MMMSNDDDLKQWLQQQPLNEAIDIDGESVYLNVLPDGAELGAYLIRSHTHKQLQDALKQGFYSATLFDAGLGLSATGDAIVLSQWLPNVSGWAQAAQPLENLLNQIGLWRAGMGESAKPPPDSVSRLEQRNEQRLRMFFQTQKVQQSPNRS